ncbi:MAG TPA: carboxy-S-adenosyl-L-methionine synthase CmoA [bacterium]|nr:carboxy-S-adenosyl-L-methionine synthase CmoA [bacterium]
MSVDRAAQAKDGAGGGGEAPHDKIFAEEKGPIQDFDFGARTAAVFDDMLHRSVPYYDQMQQMIEELAGDFAAPGSAVYDLGCSTGTTLARIGKRIPDSTVRLVGLDNSPEMLDQAREKLTEEGLISRVDLREVDLNGELHVEDASVVLLVLTLQFVRPLHRERLLRSLVAGMRPGGCLFLVEKVLGANSTLNRLFIEHYYEMKRSNGYSQMEIARKREALENVLVPYRLDENLELLKVAGFGTVEVFFKWYNFCGLIAVKG